MSKWVDVDSDGEEILPEDAQIDKESSEEEEEEEEEEEQSSHSDSNSEEEIYQKTETKKKEISYENYKPPQKEVAMFSNSLGEIKQSMTEIETKIDSMVKNLDDDKIEIKYGLSYFEGKQNIFLMYLTELVSYLLLKLKGAKSINTNDKLLKKMIILTSILDRTKIIDMKLKSQIDRLISISENKEEESNYKPRIISDENEGEEEEEEDEETKEKEKSKKKYQVQKRAIEFFETKDEKKERKRQIEKDRENIKNSEHIRNLREEMSDKPHVVNSYTSHLDKRQQMLDDYNDEYFQTIRLSKKDKKYLKKKDNKVDDLAHIDRELKGIRNLLSNDQKNDEIDDEKKFIQRKRAMNSLSNSKSKGKNKNKKKK